MNFLKVILFSLIITSAQTYADTGYELLGVVLCKAPEMCTQEEMSPFDVEVIAKFSAWPDQMRSDYCNNLVQYYPDLQITLNEAIKDGLPTCLEGKDITK